MDARLKLGYLVFEARRPARWNRLLGETLGLPSADGSQADGDETGDDQHAYRLDDACQRLVVTEGRQDDVAAIGFDVGDHEALERLARRIESRGFRTQPGSAMHCQRRRVQRLLKIQDPAGNQLEFFVGLETAATTFASPVFGGGFRTGALGMGHAALVARDLGAMEHFYAGVLGFGISERLKTRSGPLDVNGLFLHCNERHHSIALLQLPLKRRLHHFMLQAERLSDVGSAYERVQRDRHSLSLALGQHPDPDGTFSFYAATPSGFDFEIGYGSAAIDPQLWHERPSSITSTWGHRPSVRLQLQMAGAIVSSWFGGKPRRDGVTP